jgi:hypothetical protein
MSNFKTKNKFSIRFFSLYVVMDYGFPLERQRENKMANYYFRLMVSMRSNEFDELYKSGKLCLH